MRQGNLYDPFHFLLSPTSLSSSLWNLLISTAHKSAGSEVTVTSDSESTCTHYKNLEWESTVLVFPLTAFVT